MRAVDTNVLVRLLAADDDKQLKVAEEFTTEGVWISHIVLVETMWVLDAVYRRSAQQIAAAIEKLLNHQSFLIQDADVAKAALEHFRKRPSLCFSDCLVLATARKAGHLPLGTFDRTLAKLDGAIAL